MAKTEGFAGYYLDTIIADTAAGTGTELIRRTVGMAQVKDVTTIADKAKRLRAERVNIICAKDLIMNRAKVRTGGDFVAAFRRAIAAADKTF
jgi:5-methylthioribose kinase